MWIEWGILVKRGSSLTPWILSEQLIHFYSHIVTHSTYSSLKSTIFWTKVKHPQPFRPKLCEICRKKCEEDISSMTVKCPASRDGSRYIYRIQLLHNIRAGRQEQKDTQKLFWIQFGTCKGRKTDRQNLT